MPETMETPETTGKKPDTRQRAERTFLNGLMRYGRVQVGVSVGFGVVGTVAIIVSAFAIATSLAGVIVNGDSISDVSGWFYVLGGAVVVRAVSGFFQERFAAGASLAIRRGVRGEVVRKLLLSRRDPDGVSPGAGQTATAIVEQTDKLDGYFSRFVPLVALARITPLMMLVVIAPLNWVVALILALSAPLIPLYMALVGLGAEDASRRQMDSMRRLSGYFLDRLQGLPTLRRLGYTKREPENIRAASEELRERTMKVLRIAFLSSTVLEFFATFSIAIAATYVGLMLLGWLAFGPELTLQTGLFILLLAPAYFQPLRDFAAAYHDRSDALAAAKDLMPLMRTPETQNGPETSITDAPEIELSGATVRYPGRTTPALGGATLTIEAGSSLALVGPSGGGKSTLLGLVAGQITPSDGDVLIDEIPATAISPKATAWVGQRPYLFPATIRENIALGQPDKPDAEVEAAAYKARVSEFASRLPDGLDTVLGERGAGISGGEAQRVALARAFLKDAPVVLLDEPTASLDPDTEAGILATIKQLISGRTAIVATHREPLAEICDATIRIEAGRVSGAVGNVR